MEQTVLGSTETDEQREIDDDRLGEEMKGVSRSGYICHGDKMRCTSWSRLSWG